MKMRATIRRFRTQTPPRRPKAVVLVYEDEEGNPATLVSTIHGKWNAEDGPLPAWYTNRDPS